MKKIIHMIASVCVTAGTAFAQSSVAIDEASQNKEGWNFTVAPYLWFAALEGTEGVLSGLPTVDIDVSFSDILETLDASVMVALEAEKGNWSLINDVIYMTVSEEGSIDSAAVSNIRVKQLTLTDTLSLNYKFMEKENLSAKCFVGARTWYVDSELKALVSGNKFSRKDDDLWIDPLIGARFAVKLSDKFTLSCTGSCGVFAKSDEDWDLMGILGYDIKDNITLTGGYRHISVDYQENGYIYDVEISGMIFGAICKF